MNIKDTILAVGVLSFATSAHAIPVLQVGIGGGTYDTTTQTVVTSATSFSVYAYGTPGGNTSAADLLSGEYFLSIAVTPKQTETNPKPNYGSFQLNGTTINVTDDMVYGVPPVESNLAFDGGDLSRHSIFETYFYEAIVDFIASDQTTPYNVENNPSTAPTAGSGMYYDAFNIDVTNLTANIGLHFDLYSKDVKANGDVDRDDFAPFSHDAEYVYTSTNNPPNTGSSIPEPTNLALLGLAMLGFVRLSHKRR